MGVRAGLRSSPASRASGPAVATASAQGSAKTAPVPAIAKIATSERQTAMHSNPAFVDVPLRLWRSMSSIPRIHKANIAKDSDGQRAYCRTEVIKVPILTYFLGGADLGVPDPFRMSCAGRRLQGRLWRGTRIFRLEGLPRLWAPPAGRPRTPSAGAPPSGSSPASRRGRVWPRRLDGADPEILASTSTARRSARRAS
jgi:hypothetical protein